MDFKRLYECLKIQYAGRNWFDEAVKDQSVDELNGILKLFNKSYRLIDVGSLEHTTLNGGERRPDLVGITEDNRKFHLEASLKKPEYYDFGRQMEYGWRYYLSDWRKNPKDPKWRNPENYLPVISAYLTEYQFEEEEYLIDFQHKNRGNCSEIMAFKSLNASQILNNIEYKVENEIRLDWDEMTFLKFIKLMDLNLKINEILLKGIELVKNTNSIPEYVEEKIYNVYLRNCVLYVDEESAIEILEELSLRVNNDLLDAMVQLTVEDVIEERWEKAVEERFDEEVNERVNKVVEERFDEEVNERVNKVVEERFDDKKEELLEKLNLSLEDQKILKEILQK